MVMSEEPKKVNPNWDSINELYDKIDVAIVDLSKKNEMNFIEISMALQMINKKIEYEQFKTMFEFNIEGLIDKEKEGQPDGMYR
tara:strand:+ start:1786 stop:2037 length:252 start_codon:yes stop_codon:yes gene_type:complete